MTVHLVTFSDESMSRSRELCVESARRHGVDHSWPWYKGAIEHLGYVGRFPALFTQPADSRRAWAWWAFKPVIIDHQIRQMMDGDVCIYSDAGIEFIDNISHIIERMDQDIFLFGNNYPHYAWCKRDIIEAVWPCNNESQCPSPHYETWDKFGKQCQASVIIFRVSDYSRQFVKEWLDWCLFEGGRLIDDSPSRAPNHPEFQENRHDQAILTTMAYREGIRLHWWGARYNMDQPNGGFVYPKSPEYANDDYEPFVHHHRKRNHEWSNAA